MYCASCYTLQVPPEEHPDVLDHLPDHGPGHRAIPGRLQVTRCLDNIYHRFTCPCPLSFLHVELSSVQCWDMTNDGVLLYGIKITACSRAVDWSLLQWSCGRTEWGHNNCTSASKKHRITLSLINAMHILYCKRHCRQDTAGRCCTARWRWPTAPGCGSSPTSSRPSSARSSSTCPSSWRRGTSTF